MRSWAEVVKANAHIPIPPPPVSLPKLKREILRLGGNEYAVYKAKKLKEKTKKEEKRKKYYAEEKWTFYLQSYIKANTVQSAKDCYEELMGADCEDEMPWEDDPYEKQEKEARRRAMFLHSMGDYEGVYKIATRYYFI